MASTTTTCTSVESTQYRSGRSVSKKSWKWLVPILVILFFDLSPTPANTVGGELSSWMTWVREPCAAEGVQSSIHYDQRKQEPSARRTRLCGNAHEESSSSPWWLGGTSAFWLPGTVQSSNNQLNVTRGNERSRGIASTTLEMITTCIDGLIKGAGRGFGAGKYHMYEAAFKGFDFILEAMPDSMERSVRHAGCRNDPWVIVELPESVADLACGLYSRYDFYQQMFIFLAFQEVSWDDTKSVFKYLKGAFHTLQRWYENAQFSFRQPRTIITWLAGAYGTLGLMWTAFLSTLLSFGIPALIATLMLSIPLSLGFGFTTAFAVSFAIVAMGMTLVSVWFSVRWGSIFVCQAPVVAWCVADRARYQWVRFLDRNGWRLDLAHELMRQVVRWAGRFCF